MSDDFTLDFSDTEAMGGSFDPIPAGWYKVAIDNYDDAEVRNAGKLPAGTPGTNWQFVVDGGEHDGRKLWTNHWHHPKTLGFMKGMLLATEEFTEDELNGQVDLHSIRDRALGKTLAARVKVRKATDQYDARNEIGAFKPVDEMPQSGSSSSSSSLLP